MSELKSSDERIERFAADALVTVERRGSGLATEAYLAYLQRVRSLLDSSIQAAKEDLRRDR